MTRKKVQLSWITNDSARRASLKKRRLGLLKKVSELSTLCGVNAFVIIYSPDESEPVVWPSPPAVQQLLARYQNIPEMERSKKMLNQESYLRERLSKVREHLKKIYRSNKEMEMSHLMWHLHNNAKTIEELQILELRGLMWLLEEKMKESKKRIDYFRQVALPPGTLDGSPADLVNESGGADGTIPPQEQPLIWDQWFVDMVNNSDTVAGSSAAGAMRHEMGGLSYNPYGGGGGFIGAAQPDRNLNFNVTGMNAAGAVTVMGLGLHPHHGNPVGLVGGGSSSGGANMAAHMGGFAMQPHYHGAVQGGGNITGPAGNEMGMLPFGMFGGGNRNAPGNDYGLPYDHIPKNWQNNNYGP